MTLLLLTLLRIMSAMSMNAALGADLFGPVTARLAPYVPLIVAMMFGERLTEPAPPPQQGRAAAAEDLGRRESRLSRRAWLPPIRHGV